MMVACLFLSLFTNCKEKDEEVPVILTSLTVDKTSFSVEAPASNEFIAVSSNKDWTAKTESSWLSLNPSSGKADSKLSVDISISANQETEVRNATITITAAEKTIEVKIDQKGKVVIQGIAIADEKFKQYLVEAFDTNKDGEISTDEAETVTSIDCSGKGIESLSGIEFFINLETLNCNLNSLTVIDISKNLSLTTFSCDSNSIDSLGLTANTLLKVLSCSSNEMTKLDITNNTALTDLNCVLNNLADLDISKNTSLTTLDCSKNKLTGLDISKNTSLTTLDCSNNELDALDISGNSNLVSLICTDNSLKELDVSKNSSLKKLDSRNNKSLGKIKLAKDQTIQDLLYDQSTTVLEYPAPEKKVVNIPDAKFKAFLVGLFDADKDGEISEDEALGIKEIKCYQKDISSLTGLSSFTNLEILDCSGNKLTTIDLSGNLKLRELDCADNTFSTIDVRKNIALTKIHCYASKMISLDLSSNVNLLELNCSNNNFSSLDVSKNTLLQRLYCQKNVLETLDLVKNQQLKVLNCRENSSLTTVFLEEGFVIETLFIDTPPTNIVFPDYIKISDPVFLQYLLDNFDSNNDGRLVTGEVKNIKVIDCSELGISSLVGINYFTSLTTLICSGNNLTSLDLSSNTALTTLRCDSNSISSLNISKNVLLETLSCSKNSFSSIDVESNINLKTLICNGNRITSLNVDANTKLETLLCQDNNILQYIYLNKNLSLKMADFTNNSRLRVLFLKSGQTIETILYDKDVQIFIVNDDTVVEKYVNIPDPKFKAFLIKNFDTNNDGEIYETEAESVTSMNCPIEGIKSMEGIEKFTNLLTLNCNTNELTTLSLVYNTKLKEINCYGNTLTSLDVSGCVDLTRLVCGSNSISSLNLSKNQSLVFLDCSYNDIKVLNIRNNTLLSTLICSGNPSPPNILIYKYASQNPTITGAYREEVPAGGVIFDDINFEFLILSEFDSDSDGFISSDEADAITEINCPGLGIKSLKGIEEFVNLTKFNCYDNLLTGALVLTNPKLENLILSNNSITSLNVSACTSLTMLSCDNNNLNGLDLTLNIALSYLDCQSNSNLLSVKLSNAVNGSIKCHYNGPTIISYHP